MAGIQQELAQPFTVGLRLLPGLIFGDDHAYAAPMTGSGTVESVTSLTRDDVVSFHRTWYRPSNATVVVVGDVPLATLQPMLEERFGRWKGDGELPKLDIGKVAAADGRSVYLVDKPGALQSVILAGLPAPPTNNPDEISIETMNSILGGSFTSRINMNLREDKHWAYGARSTLIDAVGPRLFMAYAPVQTDKTKGIDDRNGPGAAGHLGAASSRSRGAGKSAEEPDSAAAWTVRDEARSVGRASQDPQARPARRLLRDLCRSHARGELGRCPRLPPSRSCNPTALSG